MAENCFTRRPLTILAEESVLEIHGCSPCPCLNNWESA